MRPTKFPGYWTKEQCLPSRLAEHPVQVAYPHVPIISCVAWIVRPPFLRSSATAALTPRGRKQGANLKPGPRVTHGMLEKLIIGRFSRSTRSARSYVPPYSGLYLGEGIHSPANPLSGESEDDYGDPAGYKTEGGEARKENGLRRTEAFAALLQNGGGEVEVAQNIQASRYRKQMWNAAWSSICVSSLSLSPSFYLLEIAMTADLVGDAQTLSRSTVPAVVAPEVLPFTLPVVRRTMLEVLYVARAWWVSLLSLGFKAGLTRMFVEGGTTRAPCP